MARAELTAVVEPKCLRVAEKLGFELVDVCLDKESTGKYLRIYIDRPEGMDLNGCEAFHRAIQPLVEDYDYDFLEVSSPGVDRPLKKDRDFERAIGSEVEVHLFKAMDGRKTLSGVLTDFDAQTITLETAGAPVQIQRRAASLIKPIVDMTGVEEVDLTNDDQEGGKTDEEHEAGRP